MKQRTKRLCAACLAAMMLPLGACAGEQVVSPQRQQVEITFSWWGNDRRNEYTLEAVRKFEKLHPEIKVRCSYSEWSGFEARTNVRMASNTEADVMQVNFNWLGMYSPDGTGYYDLEALTDILDLSQFSEDTLSYGRVNGILNAVPIAMNTETVYFNRTILDRYGLDVPKTWDDLFAAAEVLREDDIYILAGAQKSIWLLLLAYAEQVQGKSFLDSSGNLQFTPDDFQIMLEMYEKMIDEKVIPQIEYFLRTEIDSGRYAGAVAWVSDAVNYFSAVIENGQEIVVAPYTDTDPAHSGKGWYAKPASLYAVSRNTQQPKEAAMLLEFLLNSEDMALLQGVEKGVPVSAAAKEYLEEADQLKGIQYEASQRMEKTAGLATISPVMENSTVIEAFIECCNQVLFEKAAPAEAAQTLWQAVRDTMA